MGANETCWWRKNGIPLAITVIAANRHDSAGLDDLWVEHFVCGDATEVSETKAENLCLDEMAS